MCVCVTLVVFAGCGSCSRPISTNAGSIEACKYGLTRAACCVARRLEVVAAGGAVDFRVCFGCVGVFLVLTFFSVYFFFVFFSWNAHDVLPI